MRKDRKEKLKKLYELQDDLHSVECALSNLEYDYFVLEFMDKEEVREKLKN